MYQRRRRWLWPAVVVVSASLVGLLTVGDLHTPLRPLVALWFLGVCPGMALLHPLRLKEVYIELTLAVALSIALDTVVATVMLYAALWSTTWVLLVLIGISLGGVGLDLAGMARAARGKPGALSHPVAEES